MTNKHHTGNQPHYSENEEYYSQNEQRFSTNQQNNNWIIDQPDPIYQPDLFEPNTRNEQTRQTKQNPTSWNNNFQSQNPITTQSYQSTQTQIEMQLPYYLRQDEITKTQLTKFSQIPNAAEPPQPLNLYLDEQTSVTSSRYTLSEITL